MKAKLTFLAAGILLSGCTRPSRGLLLNEWRRESAKQHTPSFLQSPSKTEISAQWLEGRTEFDVQTVEGVEVDGSFVQKVFDKSGQLQEARGLMSPDRLFSAKFRQELRETKARKDQVLRDLRTRHSGLATARIEDFQPVILPGRQPQIAWALTFSDADGLMWRAVYSNDLQPESVTSLGSEFSDIAALAFPKGPRESRLSQVLLQGLQPGENLVSSLVRLGTAAPQTVVVTGAALNFQPGDQRFDQVQAFYFAQQALGWLERYAGFKPGLPLDIQTHLGFPGKTNTAFYYSGRVRLGEGDGVVYNRLPQDPGIVMHEVSHYLIDSMAHLPTEGEGGSLNEAFADFFACTMRDSPLLGDVAYVPAPFRRRIDIVKKLSEKSGSLYGDSQIVSSLLWEIRQRFGAAKATTLALGTLGRLNPVSTFEDFRTALIELAPGVLQPAELQTMNAMMTERGWSIR